MMILAVDPGDAHVGVATWAENENVMATEFAAEEWLAIFNSVVVELEVVVIEAFRLYPNKAAAQSWSPMATSEMIGAMKWIAHQAQVPVVMQGADIKNPTRRQCKARGIKWKQRSGHASDAILHLWYYLLRHDLEVV